MPVNSIPYYYKIAIIYALILFLDRIDLTILNIAIPTLSNVFGVQIELAEWFSLSFLIGLSIAIGISSWLGECFGYKKVFILAVSGFAAFSFFCTIAYNFETFILARLLQGFFGGIIIPSGNAILFMSCDKKDYAKVTNFVFLPTLLAPAIAPYLGGVILKHFSYKLIFYVNLPICFAIAFLSFLVIKDVDHFEKKSFDSKGFLLSVLLYIMFFSGISFISRHKFLIALGFLLVVTVLTICFVIVERKALNPIWDFKYLKLKLFRQSLLIQLFFQMSHFGSFFVIGLYLQIGLGFSPEQTGIIIAMQAVGAIIVAIPSKILFYKLGPRIPISLGMLGVGVITPLILFVTNNEQLYLAGVIMLFRGLMSGWVGTPLHTISMNDPSLQKIDLGRIGSIFNIARQLSISLGVCVSALIIGITNLFLNLDYLHQGQSYLDSVKLFGGAIAVISLFCIAGAVVGFGIDQDKAKETLLQKV